MDSPGATAPDGSRPDADSEHPLQATLVVEPNTPGGCSILNTPGQVTSVSRSVKRDDRRAGDGGDGAGYCQAALTLDGTGDVFVSRPVTDRCACPVFERTDCVPDIQRVSDDGLVVSVLVPDRSALRELVAELRATGATVRVDQLRDRTREADPSGSSAPSITSKQREAIELAVREGYYETPRETDLETLAERLGISKSAVSQRLNAAEAKLVQARIRDR